MSKENYAQGSGILEGWNYHYDGEWEKGKPNGFGILKCKNESSYEGNLVDGKPNGEGVHNFKTGYYKGKFLDGLYEGEGSIVWYNGNKFQGEFRKGK